MFRLQVRIPQSYPFEPPQIRFKTRIYHPNIDEGGRICADILKKGEHGGWKPSLNLSTTLISLRALIAQPNPDDPLDADIVRRFVWWWRCYLFTVLLSGKRISVGSSIVPK